MSYFPPNLDVSNSGAISALNQTIVVQVTPQMSNWMVQTTGTFVGTIQAQLSADGGNNYVPVNARQSLSGRIGNNWSVPGMFRGCVAGGTHFRVIATAWTSGTATVTVRLSAGTSPIFSNSVIEIRALEQYYASNAGGNVAFNSCVGAVSLTSSGGVVAILNNPANSGIDAYISRIIIGTNKPGRFERYRVAGSPTITGAFMPMSNKGGGTNTSLTKMYLPTAATISGGTLSKTTFINGNEAFETLEDGSSIVRQNQSLYWVYTPDTNTAALGTVTISFWESVSAT